MTDEPRSASDHASPPPSPGTRPRTRGRIGIMLALSLVAICVAGLLVARHVTAASPQKAASEFFRVEADGGDSAAYAAAAPTFRDTTPLGTWTQIVRSYGLQSVTGAEWTRHDGDDINASLSGVLHRTGNEDLPISLDLHRADGAWRVTTIALQAPTGSEPALAARQAADAPAQSQIGPVAAQPSAAPPVSAAGPSTPDEPGPVMSVPPLGIASGVAPVEGRSGPPGTVLAAGQVGPACMSDLWKKGIHSSRVDCPLYLPAKLGARAQCVAHLQSGGDASVTAVFRDYDPATRLSAIDCSL